MADKGKTFLLKLGSDASPPVYTTVGGLRTNSLTMNNEPVDITDKDAVNNWRQLLEAAGVKSMSFNAEGIFKTNAAFDDLVDAALADTHVQLQMASPILGTIEGLFMISNLQLSGPNNNTVAFTATFESAGTVTRTPPSP